MSHIDQGPLPAYNSLTDNNLNGYFSNTRMRNHLRKSGLITKNGEIVSENTYRLNMGRKEHKKHVKDMLAQAIVHKTLDLERSRQAEIRKKLEEIAKIELVRRVRCERRITDETLLPQLSSKTSKARTKQSGKLSSSKSSANPSYGSQTKRKSQKPKKSDSVVHERGARDRKRENYVLPLVSPRRESCQSSTASASSGRPTNRRRVTRSAGSPKRKGKRPLSALSSNYDDENETVVYLDDEGRPITPAHVDRSDLKYSSKDPIDTRHLYSLDTAALRKYAMLMAKMEQGRGGLSSPYLIPQIPLPPKSPRSGRAPLSAHRHRSGSSDVGKSVSPKRPSTAGQAYLCPSGSLKQVRGQQETMCEVFIDYHGSSLSLVGEQFDKRQEVMIEQQHCGGNTLIVFRDKMEAGTEFAFISYRHRGYPFSLSIYIDGKIDCRVSVCCEYRHAKGGRIGGKNGHFSISSITGAVPCYRCQVEKGIRVKSAAPRRKLKRPPQTMEEVTVVDTTQNDKDEEEDKSEPVEERSEEILVPVDDDDEKNENVGQTKSENDNYDDDFDSASSSSNSESGKEGFGLEDFLPKDARGVEKTTGRVDLNDSTDDEKEDLRAKTPTPHGRRKKKKKKKGQGRARSASGSSSSSSSASSSDTAKEDSDKEDSDKEPKGKKEDTDETDGKKDEKYQTFFTSRPPPSAEQKSVSNEEQEEEVKTFMTEREDAAIEKEEKEEVKMERRVSVSSTSSSSSADKDNDSSDDYSSSKNSKKGEVKDENETKEVDMGAEEEQETPVVDMYDRPGTVMATRSDMDQVDEERDEVKSAEPIETEQEQEEVQKTMVPMPLGSIQDEPIKEKTADAASVVSSSSASPSSSSGSATIHDKGPNTVNDPTVTFDGAGQSSSNDPQTLDTMWQEANPIPEKETNLDKEEDKEEDEEKREKPRVEIIREDLNKKPETGSSSSSSSDESDSDDEEKKKSGGGSLKGQTQADVHQSESQGESDPEATHGGNDPDNIANGSDLSGSRTFEPVVPAKAKPGSVLPLCEASQTTLEIKGVTLSKSQVYEVAEFLENKADINSVNLVNCGIDDDDVQKLMEALMLSPSKPVMLNLGLNPITSESVHHILSACKWKTSIEAVLLQGTRLGDDGVNALIAGMMAQLEDWKMRGEATDKGIHELDLSDCKFGDQGALGIARLLTSAVDVDTLTLTHNHAISSDGWKVIGEALKLNSNLETLTLDHNYISDEGIEYITQGLFDNTSLTALDINDVSITDKGGRSIKELLKRNTYLLEITVIENKLSEDISDDIQKYVSLNKAQS